MSEAYAGQWNRTPDRSTLPLEHVHYYLSTECDRSAPVIYFNRIKKMFRAGLDTTEIINTISEEFEQAMMKAVAAGEKRIDFIRGLWDADKDITCDDCGRSLRLCWCEVER